MDSTKDLSADDKNSSDEEKISTVILGSRGKEKSSSDKTKSSSDEGKNSSDDNSTVRLRSREKTVTYTDKSNSSSDEERNSADEGDESSHEENNSAVPLRSSGRLRSREEKRKSGKSSSSSDEENSSSSESSGLDSTVHSGSDYIPSHDSLSSENEWDKHSKKTSSPSTNRRKKYVDLRMARSENLSSGMIVIPLTKKVDGKRKWDKKHFCLYCSAPHTKISRHLEMKHAEETAVVHALRFPKGSTIRKDLFSQLRNKGDYQHNYQVLQSGNGELVTKKRSTLPTSVRDFLPCQFCCAFFRKSDLWRHERACKFRKGEVQSKQGGKGRIQSMASRLLPLVYATGGCEEIIHKMNQDEIAVHIRNDPLICKYGNALSARHDHDKSQYAYIAQKMRELARFMLAVNEVDSSVKYLHELCLPSRFELAVEGAKKVSGFDENSNKFKTTTLVSKIGYSLKRAAEIAFGESRMTEDSETEGQVREFIKLLDMEWNTLFSRSVLSSLRRAERKEVDASSLTTDLIQLYKFLKKAENESKKELLENPSAAAWRKLCEALLSEVFLFNKSRGGDAGKFLLETYTSRKSTGTPITADVLNRLTKMEVVLSDKLIRMELEGNGGRKTPLLLTEEMVSSIDALVENREKAGVHKDNPYVFGRLEALSNIRGSDCLRRASQDSNATTPDILSSSKLRKLIASHWQLLSLNDRELDQVSKLVGWDREECYRLVESPSQLEDLSRMVVALDRNSGPNHADVSFPVSAPSPRKRGWTEEEQAAVRRQLASSIQEMVVPCKRECDACIDAEPVLQSRTWKDIKNYVHNTLQTIRKRHLQGSSDMELVSFELKQSQSQRAKARTLKRKREESSNTTVEVKGPAEELASAPAPSPRKKGSWTEGEQGAVRRQFGEFASMFKAPGKRACDACIAAEPALRNRKWKEIKNYVHNSLQTMKRRGFVCSPVKNTEGLAPESQTPGENQEASPSTPVYLSL